MRGEYSNIFNLFPPAPNHNSMALHISLLITIVYRLFFIILLFNCNLMMTAVETSSDTKLRLVIYKVKEHFKAPIKVFML